MRMEERVAVITGGAGRFGGTSARLFVREGAAVVIGDLADDAGERFAESMRAEGGRVLFQKMDVTREEEARALIQRAVDEFGHIDTLVNCAGWMTPTSAIELTEEIFDRTIDSNLKGTWLTCKYALPHMLAIGKGAIVNISSMQAFGAVPHRMIYEAAKAGVSALTRQLALEYGPGGVRVNAVCPGPVKTRAEWDERIDRGRVLTDEDFQLRVDSYPLRRMGLPEDIANAILFLASDEASWITGANMVVDGGHTIQLTESVTYPPFRELWRQSVQNA